MSLLRKWKNIPFLCLYPIATMYQLHCRAHDIPIMIFNLWYLLKHSFVIESEYLENMLTITLSPNAWLWLLCTLPFSHGIICQCCLLLLLYWTSSYRRKRYKKIAFLHYLDEFPCLNFSILMKHTVKIKNLFLFIP